MNAQPSRYLSVAIFALMILAVMVKAAIPAGFMPGSEGGMVKMVICSGVGEKTIFVPADDAGDNNHEETSKDICAYQILTGQKTIPAPSIDIALMPDTQTIHYEWTVTAVLKIQSILSLNARGPPLA